MTASREMEREARLPGWARRDLNNLRRELAEARREIEELRTAPPSELAIRGFMRPDHYLPSQSTIRFFGNEELARRVSIEVRADDPKVPADGVQIMAPDGRLVIQPSASNVVYAKVVPR